MRVAVYYSNDDVRLEERPIPEIGAGEILMRVVASGVCGSDVMEWYRKPKAPIVLGHEVSGIVEKIGSGVSGFSVGDRIVTTHHVPCNACRYCDRGAHNVCETMHRTNFDPGGFSEFVRLPRVNVERGTFKIPDSVEFGEATFVEPLACVLRGQRLAQVGEGDSVLVIGAGLSGLLHLQVAAMSGAKRLFASDLLPERLDAARRFGAIAVWDASENIESQLREANDGRLADRVLVCAGSLDALQQALDLVDHAGTLLVFAPLPPTQTLELDVHDLWKRGIGIVHSYAGPPQEMEQALHWIAARRIDVQAMITHRLPLEQTQQAFQMTIDGGESLKVLIEP